jgi:hypothetical protein
MTVPMTRCMISQPRYLPALSYLQRIHHCDILIILDTVQHNRQDFEHRNRIGEREGSKWLSLPLDRSVGSRPHISELRLLNESCLEVHREQMMCAYRQADHYNENLINLLYAPIQTLDFVSVLSEMLHRSFHLLGNRREVEGNWIRASSLPVSYVKGPDYLVRLCESVGASQYISGPNGKTYITDEFERSGLEVRYHCDKPPFYSRSGLPALPWLAWIDALHHQGLSFVQEAINQPMSLSA